MMTQMGVTSSMAAGRPVESTNRPALVAGIVAAAGLLFLLCFVAIQHTSLMKAQTIITICVLGVLAGVAGAVVSHVTRGLAQGISLAGLGFFMVVLMLLLGYQFKESGAQLTRVGEQTFRVVGAYHPLGTIGAILFVLLLGALRARTGNAASMMIRWAVGSLAAALLIIQLVQWMVIIAGNNDLSRGITALFDSKQVVPITSFVWVSLAWLAILIVSLISAVRHPYLPMLTQAARVLILTLAWSLVAIISLQYISDIAMLGSTGSSFSGDSGWGSQLLAWLLSALGVLLPLFGASWLCAVGLADTLVQISLMPKAAPRVTAVAVATVLPTGAPEHLAPAAVPAAPPALPTATLVDLPAPGHDVAARLQNLKRLLDQGLISTADFEAKKQELLNQL
jgi:hypothetical protein